MKNLKVLFIPYLCSCFRKALSLGKTICGGLHSQAKEGSQMDSSQKWPNGSRVGRSFFADVERGKRNISILNLEFIRKWSKNFTFQIAIHL
jgi:hypothetical protein